MTKKPSFADIAAMGTPVTVSPQAPAPTPAEAVKAGQGPSQHQQTESDAQKQKQPLQNKTSSENVSVVQSSAPTEEKVEKPNQTKNNGSRPRSDSTPTPAESSQRKQQEKSKNRSHRNRGKGRHGGSKHHGKEKKGSWKKLDVDISFNKDQPQSSSSTTDTESRKKGGDATKSSSSVASTIKSKGDPPKKGGRGNSGRGGRNRGNNKREGDTAETNSNWREKSESSKNPTYYQAYQPPSPEVIEQMKVEAVKQIEYFFSTEELVKNVFLRRHMDIEGYLPAAIVFNFPSVARFGLPYDDLLAAVSEKSDKVDVDSNNDCLRVQDDYKKWLFPNDDGTIGCPKWLKQVEEAVTNDQKDSLQSDENQDPKNKVETPTQKDEESEKQLVTDIISTKEDQKLNEKAEDNSKNEVVSSPPELTMTDSDTDHESR